MLSKDYEHALDCFQEMRYTLRGNCECNLPISHCITIEMIAVE